MKQNSNPKIIAIGYYDGATEGFIQAVFANQPFYFKLIAWDDQLQDKRVFVLKKVGAERYAEFVQLIKDSHESFKLTPTWLPNWSFPKDDDREKADRFLEECRDNSEVYLLVLGSNIEGKVQSIIPTSEIVTKALNSASKEGVDSIENWIDLFTDSNEIEL